MRATHLQLVHALVLTIKRPGRSYPQRALRRMRVVSLTNATHHCFVHAVAGGGHDALDDALPLPPRLLPSHEPAALRNASASAAAPIVAIRRR